MPERTRLSILVVSCDAYSDVWGPFFAFFRRNWSDCPYPVFVGSNLTPCSEQGVTPLAIGPDRSWSDSLRAMLERIPSDYVLTIQEDFLISKSVRTEDIERCFQFLQSVGGVCVRLKAAPPPDKLLPESALVGEVSPGQPFRVSNQASIWKKASLQSLLVSGESPWDMEIRGTKRSDTIPAGFYSVWESVLEYEGHGAVSRGIWEREWVHRCNELGVFPDLNRRRMMTRLESFRWRAGTLAYNSFEMLPPRLRSAVRRLLPLRWTQYPQ